MPDTPTHTPLEEEEQIYSNKHKKGRYHKPIRDNVVRKVREMLIASYTTDEILAAFPNIPKRTLYRYLDIAFVDEAKIAIDPEESRLQASRGIIVYIEQLKRMSRKLEEKIIDNETVPAKNRIEGMYLKKDLDYLVARTTHQLGPALTEKGGMAQLLSTIESVIHNSVDYQIEHLGTLHAYQKQQQRQQQQNKP